MQYVAYTETGKRHAGDYDQCRHHCGGTRFHQLAEREFQSDAEHQHHDTQVGPECDVVEIGYRGKVLELGRRQEPCEDISEHYRLFELLEQECHQRAQQQYPRQVGYQAVGVRFFGRRLIPGVDGLFQGLHLVGYGRGRHVIVSVCYRQVYHPLSELCTGCNMKESAW